MSQHYSDPERATDPYGLPDVEVWEDFITIIRSRCGEFEVPRESEWSRGFCPSCDHATCVNALTFEDSGIEHTKRTGWFFWYCLPGCLPDSEPRGPYATEQEAIDAAQAE